MADGLGLPVCSNSEITGKVLDLANGRTPAPTKDNTHAEGTKA
jgi:hypothetical protein